MLNTSSHEENMLNYNETCYTPVRISKITEGRLTVSSTIKYVNPLKLSSSAGDHVIQYNQLVKQLGSFFKSLYSYGLPWWCSR